MASFNIAHEFDVPDTIRKKEVEEIPLLSCEDKSISISSGDLMVVISSEKFDSSKHNLTYDSEKTYLKLIDGKTFWGEDGGVPNEEVRSIVITIGKKRFSLPKNALDGIYQPNFCFRNNLTNELTLQSKVFRSKDKRRVYIFMNNSDGAGGYEVTWIIQDGKYLTRVVDLGS